MSFLYDVKKKHLRFTDLSLSTCPHWVVGGLLWPWAEVFLSQHQCSAPPALLAPKSQCRPMLTALPPSAWTRPPLTRWTRNSFRSWPKLSLTQKRPLRWIFLRLNKSSQIPESEPQPQQTVSEILFLIFCPFLSCRPSCSRLETKSFALVSTSRRCTSRTRRGWKPSGEVFKTSGWPPMDASCQWRRPSLDTGKKKAAVLLDFVQITNNKLCKTYKTCNFCITCKPWKICKHAKYKTIWETSNMWCRWEASSSLNGSDPTYL